MISRKIAVLGGGNGAHCMAADMKLKGHTVKMFEFPEYKHICRRYSTHRQLSQRVKLRAL